MAVMMANRGQTGVMAWASQSRDLSYLATSISVLTFYYDIYYDVQLFR